MYKSALGGEISSKLKTAGLTAMEEGRGFCPRALNRRIHEVVDQKRERAMMDDRRCGLKVGKFNDALADSRQAQACGYQGLRRRKHRSPAPD